MATRLYGSCAIEVLIFPAMPAPRALIESTCPATGWPIHPNGISNTVEEDFGIHGHLPTKDRVLAARGASGSGAAGGG